MTWKQLVPVFLLALVPLVWGGKMCLHAGDMILEPVILRPSDCIGANATVGCMARIYNYRDFKYNGPPELLPNLGEIFSFVVIDPFDNIDAVMIMNPKNRQTVIETSLSLEGVGPTRALLLDDHPPVGQDQGYWDGVKNTGQFNLTVQPHFTDGVVIGHLNFINHYCMEASYIPRLVGQIEYLTLVSGTLGNITRASRAPFTAAARFRFCQFPVVEITKKDITGCPGGANGYANITVDKLIGPPGNYSYTWLNAAGDVISTGTGIYNLRAGTYTLIVEVHGCDTNRTVIIRPPPPVTIENIEITFETDGQATANVTSVKFGQPPYTYRWTKGATVISTTPVARNLILGESYNLTVTDTCGVEADKVVTINCPPGRYFNSTLRKCLVCPPGSYSDKPGVTCIRCPMNTYTPGGMTKCSPCALSHFSAPGSAKCTPCPPGMKRNAAETSCSNCPGGTFRCSGTGCQNCPIGTFSKAGAANCEPCDPGYFTSTVAQTSCKICPVGTYSMGGATVCTTCPVGTTSTAGSNDIAACD